MNIKLVLRILLAIGIIITIVVCYSLSITISIYSYNLYGDVEAHDKIKIGI